MRGRGPPPTASVMSCSTGSTTGSRDLFRTHLWEPFVEIGLSHEQVTRLIGALRKLGPLAEAVVVTSLRHALQEAAERFLQAEAERLGIDIPRPGQSDEPGFSRTGPP